MAAIAIEVARSVLHVKFRLLLDCIWISIDSGLGLKIQSSTECMPSSIHPLYNIPSSLKSWCRCKQYLSYTVEQQLHLSCIGQSSQFPDCKSGSMEHCKSFQLLSVNFISEFSKSSENICSAY